MKQMSSGLEESKSYAIFWILRGFFMAVFDLGKPCIFQLLILISIIEGH